VPHRADMRKCVVYRTTTGAIPSPQSTDTLNIANCTARGVVAVHRTASGIKQQFAKPAAIKERFIRAWVAGEKTTGFSQVQAISVLVFITRESACLPAVSRLSVTPFERGHGPLPMVSGAENPELEWRNPRQWEMGKPWK
jgi:hypothetical protein